MQIDWRSKWIWGTVVISLAVGRVLGDSKPAATVNGEPIPVSEVDAVLSLRPPELFPITAAQQKLIRHEVLEALISDRLMKQFLAKNAPPVDQREVDKQLKALTEVLKSQGKTVAEFCKESQQTEEQLRTGIANMIQFNSYARQKTTEQELKKYFADNIDYFRKTTVRLSHIVIRIPNGVSAAERAETIARLRDIRQQIASGKVPFGDAAREHSHCPSAAKGGDIGLVARKWMVDEAVARVAFAMKKDELSDVVESEFGLHLLKVVDRNEGGVVEYVTVQDEVRESYIEEMKHRLLLELRKSARVEIHSR